MTGFRDADHPRISDGTFTDKTHTAPELTLGDASAGGAPLVVDVAVYWYEPNVLLTPRHTKPRTVRREQNAQLTIPTTTSEDAPVGFTVTTTGSRFSDAGDVVSDIRFHDGKFYGQITENIDGTTGPVAAASKAVSRRAFHYLQDGRASLDGDTEEQALADAQSHVENFLIIDGQLWEKTSEPVYYVNTYGMGPHSSTVVNVAKLDDFLRDTEHAADENLFHASDRDAAIAFAENRARQHGGVTNIGEGDDIIEVADGFTPGATFTPAPRISYMPPYDAYYAEKHDGDTGALKRGLAEMRQQLLNVPGAVVDVPDGWGGTTKVLDTTKVTRGQAAHYAKYLQEIAELDRTL